MISELGENRASGIIWRHTIYAIRVTFHGDLAIYDLRFTIALHSLRPLRPLWQNNERRVMEIF